MATRKPKAPKYRADGDLIVDEYGRLQVIIWSRDPQLAKQITQLLNQAPRKEKSGR